MHETREISQLGMFGLNMCPETLWREIIQGGRVVIIWDTLFRTFLVNRKHAQYSRALRFASIWTPIFVLNRQLDKMLLSFLM